MSTAGPWEVHMTVFNHLNPPAVLAGFVAGLGLTPLIGHTWPMAAFPLSGGLWPVVGGLVGAVIFRWLHRRTGLFVARWAAREPAAVTRQLAWTWLPLSLIGVNLILDSRLAYRWLPGGWPGIDVNRGWLLVIASVLLSMMFTVQVLRRLRVVYVPAWLPPVFVGVLALAVYLRTMSAHVGQADTFEFQVTAYSLGIAHPTGYPLYVLLGHLFAWVIPVGSVAWRVNLTAVLPAAAAVGGIVGLSRWQGAGFTGALLGGLTLAFSLTFWRAATAAEVYALNALLVVLVLGSLYALSAGRRDVRVVYLLAAAVGLGLAHHLTIILLVPAIALALLATRPRLAWFQWLAAAGLCAAGAAIVLYIPLRWPAITGQGMTPADFVAYITGQQYAGALQWSLLLDPARWSIIARIVLAQLGPIGVTLAGLGLVVTALRRPLWGVVTGLVAALYLTYGLAYNVPDVDVFILPAVVVAVVWMASGLAFLADGLPGWLSRMLPRLSSGRYSLSVLVVLVMSLLPLAMVAVNWAEVDRSAGDGGESWARQVISAAAGNAVILADGEKIASLEYVHRVEGLAPGQEMVVRFQEAGYRESLSEALGAGRPVYLARYLPDLQSEFYLSSAGPVITVRNQPPETPGIDFEPVGAVFGGEVSLVAARLPTAGWQEGHSIPFTLAWQRVGEVAAGYEIRIRLRWAGVDEPVWQEAAYAAGGMYPANAWKPDEVVYDYHALSLGHGLATGQPLLLEVGVFEPYASGGLPLADGREWFELAAVTILPDPDPPPPVVRLDQAVMPGLLLLGYDRQTGTLVDDTIIMHWLALSAGDYALTLSLLPVGDAPGTGEAVSSEIALGDLEPGERRTTRQTIDVACRASDCPAVQMTVDGQPVAVLPRTAAPDGLADFGGVFSLDEVELNSDRARPGDLIVVETTWTAVVTPEDDYTVFVQIVGPDGDLWGQVDTYPLQGTLATSDWLPGERIADRYELRLRPDAPPGAYRVIIGFYLLRTGDRLDLMGNEGYPLADHFTIGTVTVVD